MAAAGVGPEEREERFLVAASLDEQFRSVPAEDKDRKCPVQFSFSGMRFGTIGAPRDRAVIGAEED